MTDWDHEPDWWHWENDVDAVTDCLLVSSMDSLQWRLDYAGISLLSDDQLVECPGEAHIKDGCFNPTSQDCYGPGAHNCDLCENEGEITFIEYKSWAKQVKYYLERVEARRIKLEEEKEQAKLVKSIMNLPKSNVPTTE